MVVCDFIAHISHVRKHKFLLRICTLKLRVPAIASQFQLAFELKVTNDMAATATAAGVAADTANQVETFWSKLKDPLLDAASKVCGLSKNHQLRPETS